MAQPEFPILRPVVTPPDPNETIKDVGNLMRELFSAANDDIAQRRYFAARVLLFSTMDILASLNRPAADYGECTRKDVLAWLKRFAAVNRLGLKPIDVYAARCGHVHGGTPDSSLAKKGEARLISWIDAAGNQSAVRAAQAMVDKSGASSVVVDHLAFHGALLSAFGLYIAELKKRPDMQASFLKHGGAMFTTVYLQKASS